MDKPDVDFIEGLSPAVSIDQKSTSKNPRSTVGTITEVYDYLRLLWARIGKPHCPVCGELIAKQTPQQIVDRILELDEGTRFQVLAPVIRERKGEYVDLFADLQTKGFARVRVDGVVHPLTEPPKLKKQEKHTIEAVVDRLAVRPSSKQRITDSIETALNLAGGLVVLDFVDLDEADPHRERRYSERLACPNDHPLAIDELEPRSFSFNSPFGACPVCTGLGTRMEVDPELVVPDPEQSLAEGAVAPWATGQTSEYFLRLLQGVADQIGFSVDTAWEELPARAQKAVLHGTGEQVHVSYRNRYGRDRSYYANYEGAIPWIERRYAETDSDYSRDKYEGFMREVPVPDVPGHPAQARDPGGHRARPLDRRDRRAVDRRRRRVAARPRPRPAREDHRRAGAQGDQRPARLPRRRRACTTSRSTAPRRRSPAARRSASGWRRRSAPGWSASSTSWTSRRSACTSATTTG